MANRTLGCESLTTADDQQERTCEYLQEDVHQGHV